MVNWCEDVRIINHRGHKFPPLLTVQTSNRMASSVDRNRTFFECIFQLHTWNIQRNVQVSGGSRGAPVPHPPPPALFWVLKSWSATGQVFQLAAHTTLVFSSRFVDFAFQFCFPKLTVSACHLRTTEAKNTFRSLWTRSLNNNSFWSRWMIYITL